MTTLLTVGGVLLGCILLIVGVDRWMARNAARKFLRRHSDTEPRDPHRW